MARRKRTGSDAKKDADIRADKKNNDDKKKAKKSSGTPASAPGTVTESLKAKSTQSGDAAMNAVPNSTPAEPANAEAVYTTGPGQAIEYNYTRLGTYSEDYAQQQSQATAPVPRIAGNGQVLTSAASGASNNPT